MTLKDDSPAPVALAWWAADCAARVLSLFEASRPADLRPRRAIEAARAWARGEIKCAAARAAAVAAHTAARDCTQPGGIAAARAAGHAAATAHMSAHARHAAAYSVKAVIAAGGDRRGAEESGWQARQLADQLPPILPSSSGRGS
jgi:hypothetical protein